MIVLTALFILGSAAKSIGPDYSEIDIRIDLGFSIERVAHEISRFGRLDSRIKGTNEYSMRVNKGTEYATARQRLLKMSGVHLVEAKPMEIDMTSVKSIDRELERLTGENEGDSDRGSSTHKADGTDYLRAYRYFVGQRAYPKNKVDWSAYTRGRTQVSQMLPANINWPAHANIEGSIWHFLGPTNLQVPYNQYFGVSPLTGRVSAVAFDPNNSQVIYAAGGQGGLWKSTDGGQTWSWLSTSWPTLGVNCISIDPQDGNIIYIGLGDYHGFLGGSYGIMKSTDGGFSWNEIATPFIGQVGVIKILIDPTNDQTLIAGTGDIVSTGKLYRSINGGATWSAVTTLTKSYWPAISASLPSSGKTRFYAVAAGYGGNNSSPISRVYKSDDHGATWQSLTSPIQTDLTSHWAYCVATSPTLPNNVYVLDSEHEKLYESTNQGLNWSDISANLPQGNEVSKGYNFSQDFYDYHLECGSRLIGSNNVDALYLGEIDLVESFDNGATWQSLGGPTYDPGAISHNDQHALAICPTNPNFVLFGNDGGIYSAVYTPSNQITEVTPLNQYLQLTMFYKIAMDPLNANAMIGGTQDNASPIATGSLATWLNVGGGDGGGCAINQVNPQIQYCTIEDLLVYRTGNGWSSSFKNISPKTGTDPHPFVAPIVLASSDQTKLYTGTNYLYSYNDTTGLWTNHVGGTRLAGAPSGANSPLIQAIAVAPSDATRIYTGSSDNQLWMSTNAGLTWLRLNPNISLLPQEAITSISVSPSNPNDILIGFSGTDQNGHLWRCSDTIASSPAFSNVSSVGVTALPSISLNAIARDIDNPATTWFVATDLGIFRTADSGATWQDAGHAYGLPNVIVDDLVAVPGTRFLNAGTYGRGIWQLYLPTPTVELSGLTLSSNSIRRGNSVVGTVTLSAVAGTGGTVVQLGSSDTAAATVPATVTVASGQRSASFTVTTSGTLTAPASTVISATYNGVTKTQTLNVTVPTISGAVKFNDYLGAKPTSVVLNFRMIGATSTFMTKTVTLDSQGNFVAVNVPAEQYDVFVWSGTWLRRTLFCDLTQNDVSGANYSLINGDIDGNNRVDINDRRKIALANGSKPGDPNWNPRADLNGDGVVDATDYAILYKNYGQIGDP